MTGEAELDLRVRKTALDVPTLFRVLPWLFLMHDQRDPRALVEAALRDTRGFLDAFVDDPTRDRKALMRGLAMNWFRCMGGDVDPKALEMVVTLIAQAVDGVIDAQFKNDLTGDPA